MAGEATRDAKLSLKFDTSEAVKGMKDVEQAGKRVVAVEKEMQSAADAATKTLNRYGPSELSRTEMRRQRAAERRVEREHDDAFKRVEEYRLAKHYSGIRGQRAEAARYDSEMAAARQVKPEGGGKYDAIISSLKAAGVIGMIVHELRADAAMLNTAANIDLTGPQKRMQTLTNIPAVGSVIGAARDFWNAITGVTERMRQFRIQIEKMVALRGGHWTNEAMRLDFATQANEARRESQAIRGASVPPIGGDSLATGPGGQGGLFFGRRHDRATVAGEIGYQEELQRLPGIDAALAAQRRAEAALATQRDAEEALRKIEGSLEITTHRRQGAQQRYSMIKMQEDKTGVRNQVGRQAALGSMHEANIDIESLNDLRIQQIQKVRDASVDASRAEAEARARNIDLMRTELQISEARTNRLVSAAERFGAMNPLEQALAAAALRAVNDRGVRGVTPEVLQRAASLNPDFVRMAQRNRAETEPAFQQLRAEGLLGEGTRGSIAENQGATERLRQQIREETLANQQRLAGEVSETLGKTFETIITTFITRMKALEARVTFALENQFNAQQ